MSLILGNLELGDEINQLLVASFQAKCSESIFNQIL